MRADYASRSAAAAESKREEGEAGGPEGGVRLLQRLAASYHIRLFVPLDVPIVDGPLPRHGGARPLARLAGGTFDYRHF